VLRNVTEHVAKQASLHNDAELAVDIDWDPNIIKQAPKLLVYSSDTLFPEFIEEMPHCRRNINVAYIKYRPQVTDDIYRVFVDITGSTVPELQ